jgi:predicted PurR-regulated permease PerM
MDGLDFPQSAEPDGQGRVAERRMSEAARHAFVGAIVVVAVVACALAAWKLRIVLAGLFFAFILAAAMRPSVDALARRRVPRGLGVLLHYAVFAALLAGFLALVVPIAVHQVDAAIAASSGNGLKHAANESSGMKRQLLLALDRRLHDLPPLSSLIHPALSLTVKALKILAGIFFVLASAAYWVVERDRAEALILSLVPRKSRRVVKDTWRLVDGKLGAFVRGQLLMITFVSTVLSLAFWQIGVPYWLLLGAFAGLVEILPVVGPFIAGAAAIGAGLTVSWHTAALAAVAVYGLRLFQDYILNPRVLGHAVGLTPLTVLVVVSAVGILFGPLFVPIATPFAAVLATLLDVLVRGKDPAEEEVPKVLFSARDREPAGVAD